jgi:hypothetical protein
MPHLIVPACHLADSNQQADAAAGPCRGQQAVTAAYLVGLTLWVMYV